MQNDFELNEQNSLTNINSLTKQQQKKLGPKLPKQQKKALKWLVVFFALMVAFTFISRAADSLTVPKVNITIAKGARLEFRTDAEGIVEPKKEIMVSAESGFKIAEIMVKEGQAVKRGDILVRLDNTNMKDQLEQKELELKKAEIEEQVTRLNKTESEVEDNTTEALDLHNEAEYEYEEQMREASQKVEDAKEAIAEAEADLIEAQDKLTKDAQKMQKEAVEKAQEELVKAQRATYDAIYARDLALKKAAQVIEDAREPLDEEGSIDTKRISRAYESYQETEIAQNKEVFLAQEAEQKARKALEEAANSVSEDDIAAQIQAIETAEKNIKDKQKALEKEYENRDETLRKAERSLEQSGDKIVKAQEKDIKSEEKTDREKKAEQLSQQSRNISMQEKVQEISKLKKLINMGGDIVAQVDGVITKIEATVGGETTGGMLLMMSDDSQGYQFKADLPKDMAKFIKRNDEAVIIPVGEQKKLEGAVVESLRSLIGEESGKIEVIATLPAGIGEAGLMATLRIEKQSETYPVTVPISAVFGSGDDTFLLLVREQDTILGEQSVAEKVSINVIEKDKANAAIETSYSFRSDDMIITQSSKPIAQGDRVRVEIE